MEINLQLVVDAVKAFSEKGTFANLRAMHSAVAAAVGAADKRIAEGEEALRGDHLAQIGFLLKICGGRFMIESVAPNRVGVFRDGVETYAPDMPSAVRASVVYYLESLR